MRIHSVAAAVPKTVVRNEDMIPVFGSETVEKIIAGTGVRERRRAAPELCSSDLCFAAAEEIFQKGNVPRESVNAVLFVSQTPDYAFLPQTAPDLARRLGLSDSVFAVDFKPGCTGFTDGLILAESMIASGRFRRVLLLAGDTLSKHLSPTDQGTALLFGDAGSAVLLDADTPDPGSPDVDGLNADNPNAGNPETGGSAPCETFHFLAGTDGTGADIIRIPHGDRNPDDLSEFLTLDGAKVFAFTIHRIPPLIAELLKKTGWTVDEVKGFILHQANAYILNYLGRKSRIPREKLPMSIERYGNTSSASIPLTLIDQFNGNLTRGDRLVFVGFGVGLLWSGVALTWNGGTLYPIIEI